MSRAKFRELLLDMFTATDYRCLNCGRDVFDNLGFCPDCMKKVVFNNGKTCKRCGVALDTDEDYCGNCAFDKIYFDRAYSPFCYEGVIRKAVLDMKFNNLGANAKVLARYLVFEADRQKLEYDLVTYAPVSTKTLKTRRYNQAQLLARAFCDILNKTDLLAETVVKIRETSPQEKLSRSERKTNLVGSYRLHPLANVKNKRILLIDDVKTTGATINECAKVLKRHGAAQVTALTLASRKESLDYEISEE